MFSSILKRRLKGCYITLAGSKTKMRRDENEIIQFFQRYQAEHGMPPTMREVADAFDISSTSVVTRLLKDMARRKKLRKATRTWRAYYVSDGSFQPDPLEAAEELAAARERISSGEDTQEVLNDALLTALPVNHRRVFRLINGSSKGMLAARVAEITGLSQSSAKLILEQLREFALIAATERAINGQPRTVYLSKEIAQADRDSGGTGKDTP